MTDLQPRSECAGPARLPLPPTAAGGIAPLDAPPDPAAAIAARLRRRLGPTRPGRYALQQFYVPYKYLVMSRHVPTYQSLGRLLGGSEPLSAAAVEQVIGLLARALARRPTRAGNGNALLHVRGYLKRRLSVAEQAELSAAIDGYLCGRLAFAAPVDLLRRHFQRYPDAYIQRQLFLQPPGRGG